MKVFIAGGAGFIGSHIAHHYSHDPHCESLLIYDNFTSGKTWHISDIADNPKVTVVKSDIKDLDRLTLAMAGSNVVFHFASNPDIAKAMTQPDIDFWEGTYLTQNILEAMRINKVKEIIYASGSGIYGETGFQEVKENHAPLLPISTYGASKLAGEALICSYCHMFDMTGKAFRFANVVGPRQTHGVAFDFIKKLREHPEKLHILGDGTQSKSYIYIEDIINAILIAKDYSQEQFDYFNVATGDYITVQEIAEIVIEQMGLQKSNVLMEFTGGDRGWKGDVPIVRFNTSKILSTGWEPQHTSRQAIKLSIEAMLQNL